MEQTAEEPERKRINARGRETLQKERAMTANEGEKVTKGERRPRRNRRKKRKPRREQEVNEGKHREGKDLMARMALTAKPGRRLITRKEEEGNLKDELPTRDCRADALHSSRRRQTERKADREAKDKRTIRSSRKPNSY